MLNYILGLFTGMIEPEVVTYMDLRDGALTFLSGSCRRLGETVTVRLLLKAGPEPVYLDAEVSPTRVYRAPSGLGFVCESHVVTFLNVPSLNGVVYFGQLRQQLAANSGLGQANKHGLLEWLHGPRAHRYRRSVATSQGSGAISLSELARGLDSGRWRAATQTA